MLIKVKKEVLFFIVDILFFVYIFYYIAKSELELVFHFVFFYFFIPVWFYFKIKGEASIPGKTSTYEKIFYTVGVILIVIKFNLIKEIIIKYNIDYEDLSLMLNSFFPSLGAFILMLRLRDFLPKIKILVKSIKNKTSFYL